MDDAAVVHLGGSSEFGREVVGEMNRIGMIVDISHVSDETFGDVIEVTRAPVIASHSSTRALTDHPRNMTDDMLRAVANNGGVVMVNFYTHLLDPKKTTPWNAVKNWVRSLGSSGTPLSVLADHVDHVVKDPVRQRSYRPPTLLKYEPLWLCSRLIDRPDRAPCAGRRVSGGRRRRLPRPGRMRNYARRAKE